MSVPAFQPPTSPIETEVRRIRTLLEQRAFAPALEAAGRLLTQVPENRDVLYIVAVCERYLNRVPEALATLTRLEQLHPSYSRLFQERGHCFVTLRAAQPAIDAFLRAVNLNPALPASWKALHSLYRLTGQQDNASTAASHVDTLAGLPVEVVTASSMLADGELQPAERMIRQFLLKHGEHVEAMRVLAKIGMKLGILDDAETLLERLLELAPDYQAARFDYARVLLDRHRDAKALGELEKLLEADPQNRSYRAAAASARVGLGDAQGAVRRYRELLAETPQAPELHLSVAHALKTLGQQAQAVASYRTAATLRPSYGDAYWSLANLKTYRFADAELSQMRAAEAAASTSIEDRFHLCFALGKALEDRGEYDESFQYYARGNALKKAHERLPGTGDRAQRAPAGADLHGAILRRAARLRRRKRCADLRSRTAALGLDTHRADPRLALAGGRHHGACRDPAPGGRAAGSRVPRRCATTLPGDPAPAERRGLRRAR